MESGTTEGAVNVLIKLYKQKRTLEYERQED
jgi:hypothetical protein